MILFCLIVFVKISRFNKGSQPVISLLTHDSISSEGLYMLSCCCMTSFVKKKIKSKAELVLAVCMGFGRGSASLVFGDRRPQEIRAPGARPRWRGGAHGERPPGTVSTLPPRAMHAPSSSPPCICMSRRHAGWLDWTARSLSPLVHSQTDSTHGVYISRLYHKKLYSSMQIF
jgi:hypothetical protein